MMQFEELDIPVGDAKPGDRYNDPELGLVMIRNSVPARAFSLFVGMPRGDEPEPWCLVVLHEDDPKVGIGFKGGRDTMIHVQRPYLSLAPERAQHLADLRRAAARLQRQATKAAKAAREYERGKRVGRDKFDYSASGGTPLSHEERALAQRIVEEWEN